MKKPYWTLLAALALGVAVPALPAQEAGHSDDMRFVSELRKRRYNDLALQFLLKLETTASPALKKELPLEIAKTRLEAAGDEPDTLKRLGQYRETREEFKKFLEENKKHPRAAEVRFDLARVLVLQGRTELSRAWLQDSLENRVAEGLKARATFVEAGIALQAACVEIGKALDEVRDSTSAGDKAVAKKLQETVYQCELEKGLNLFDLAQTYLDEGKDAVLKERGQKMQQAQQVLEKVGAMDDSSPICWQAKAWAGRCYHELGEPKKARQSFTHILAAGREAADGKRLARYFRLLVIGDPTSPPERDENGKPENGPAIILEAGSRWLREYPAYRNTTEAQGLRYLMARTYIAQTKAPKFAANQKKQYLENASALLGVIESTENEYTDRARQAKIAIVREQGAFDKDITKLNTFQECFLRAQFEIAQMGEDAKNSKSDKELEEKRKGRLAKIIQALTAALSKPDAKNKKSLDINNARSILTFYALRTGDYKQAIEVGEAFARADPRAAQAAMAAVYALQAYAQSIGDKERKMATPEEIKDERDKMLALARYMKERWPNELAGNLARHQLGLLLIREKNLPDAVKELAGITKDYPSFTISQFQLAESCMQAERDKLEPIAGDKPDGYRTRSIAALESIPDLVAGADPMTSYIFMMARVKLLQEWFKVKKYKEMQELAAKLLPQAGSLKFNDTESKNIELRDNFKKSLGDMRLYGLYGLAQADFDKHNHAAVAALLDPLVAEAKANPDHQVIKNAQLGNVLLSMELRSNIQLGKLDQAKQVIPLLQAVATAAGNEAGPITLLKQLVAIVQRQLEETGKKDEASLDKMRKGFTAILDELTKQQTKPSPEFILLLAQNYATMGEYKKAASLLEQVPEPKPDDMQAKKLYQTIRLLYVRQLRLDKQIDKAKPILLEQIIGKDHKGWGARNIDALMEEVQLLEVDGDFAEGAKKANRLVQQLIKKAATDNALKEKYLEAYYHVVYCFLKHGQNQPNAAMREKYIKDAANQIVALEKRWMGFGSDASTKRIQDLLQNEVELKTVYDAVKPPPAATEK